MIIGGLDFCLNEEEEDEISVLGICLNKRLI